MALSQRLFSDAYRDMQRAMAALEHPLFDLTTGPSSSFSNRYGIRYPSTDMVETPDAYELHAELPGYDKKDIKIEMSDSHTLVISGNIEKEYKSDSQSEEADEASSSEGTSKNKQSDSKEVTTTKKDDEKQVGKPSSGHKWLVQERTSGSFVRSFSLPVAVKADTIKASYNNGVLKVVIPKAQNKESNKINIE